MALVMHPLYLEAANRLHQLLRGAARRRRGRAAGVDRLYPYLFRHTYAHEALSAGMQEGEVMALAGWRSREMLSRYAKSAERERAIAVGAPLARRVNVGAVLGSRLQSATCCSQDRRAGPRCASSALSAHSSGGADRTTATR